MKLPTREQLVKRRKPKLLTVGISPAGLRVAAKTSKDPLERRVALWALRELCPNYPHSLTPFYDMPGYRRA